jgi:hypothetical protein
VSSRSTVASAVRVLAENNFGDTRSGGLAGPMGLFIILLLAVATVLLIRNMNTRLRRLPERFPAPGEEPTEPGAPAEPTEPGAPAEATEQGESSGPAGGRAERPGAIDSGRSGEPVPAPRRDGSAAID